MKFIGFYDYTTWLTYISLGSAIMGILQATKEHLGAAVFCIFFSGFCDMFDGIVARTKKDRTEDQKNFGIQIDSLTDVIAFGVTPAITFYFHGVDGALGVIILILYVLCGLSRLAFFNVLETKRQANPNESACLKAFRGMPITFSAIITPIVHLIGRALPDSVSIWLYHVAPLLMAFFFIYDISIPKLDVGAMLFGKKK